MSTGVLGDVYEKTRRNLKSFHNDVLMTGGWYWNHPDTIKRIDLYYNSQFESGNRDSMGFRKYFFNITKPSCDVATKFIDLDTKDIILTSDRSGDEYKVWVMQRDLKQWLKENKFANLLNEISFDYSKYGSVVIKKGNESKWSKVNIQNLRLDPTVKEMQDSSFVYEVLKMSRGQIESMPWNKEEVEKLFVKNPLATHFLIYECYEQDKGKWERSFRTEFLSGKSKQNQTYTRTAESQINDQIEYAPGITLHTDEVDDLSEIYKELHWEKVPGRWLGFGFAEYLFDNQIRMNELTNVKARGLYFTSLKLYQTSDETVKRNILTDMENGEIIQTIGGIQPVVNEERNLSVFAQEENRWDLNSERKTFSFDVARGETLPAQTPLGVANLTAGMISSYFDLKRENFGLFIKDLLLDSILPSFQKAKGSKHWLKFLGSDKEISKLHKALKEHTLRSWIIDYALKNSIVPSPVALQLEQTRLELSMKKKKDITLEIPDGFYSGVKLTMDIVVTGEQFDSGARLQTLQTALQIWGSNPALMANPGTRTIFLKLLELAGVSGVDLDLMEERFDETEQGGLPPQGQAPLPKAPAGAGGMIEAAQAV